jgi:hypothetical protein
MGEELRHPMIVEERVEGEGSGKGEEEKKNGMENRMSEGAFQK